jgi:hypothetical protein
MIAGEYGESQGHGGDGSCWSEVGADPPAGGGEGGDLH